MKILCKFHADSNPSMEVYHQGDKYTGYCFVCKTYAELDERDLEGVQNAKLAKKPKTNVNNILKYIQSLPVHRIRGLDLPSDELGLYIVWPNNQYYKRRNFRGKVRYTGPTGVKAPLMVFKHGNEHIMVIEGELNAMSIEKVNNSDITIASPGSASEFIRHIQEYLPYKEITLVLDHDAAGVAFGLQLKEELLKFRKRVNLVTKTRDYNDILQQQGEETLLMEFAKDVK